MSSRLVDCISSWHSLCLCVERRWRIEIAVWICSLFGIQSVADVVTCCGLRWFGHLEHRSVDDWVSAYIKRWRWQGWDVRGGIGRHGRNVWVMTWKGLVCSQSREFSGICGGTSYGETSNQGLALKKWRFQNKWWWRWFVGGLSLPPITPNGTHFQLDALFFCENIRFLSCVKPLIPRIFQVFINFHIFHLNSHFSS